MTELEFINFQFDPKSSLSEDEQIASVTMKNLAILFNIIVKTKGDQEIVFCEKKCKCSELVELHYRAAYNREFLSKYVQLINTIKQKQAEEYKTNNMAETRLDEFGLYSANSSFEYLRMLND